MLTRTDDDKVRLLRGVPMLAGCGRRQLAKVAGLVDEVEIPAGTRITREGSYDAALYIIVEGVARITRGVVEVSRLGAGRFFGELALLDPAPRNATVTALTDMRVLSVSRREFWTLTTDVAPFTVALLSDMTRRILEAEAVGASA